MSIAVLLAFTAACWLLAWTPGPAMSLIASNTITFGRRAGLMSVAGNTTGLALLVVAVALGMSSVMAFVADWFDLLRWAGALYLIFLGALRLYRIPNNRGRAMAMECVSLERGGSGNWMLQGFAVALCNPKVLLFLSAFFPQFLDSRQSVGLQLAILSVIFIVVMGVADALSVWLIARARRAMVQRWQIMDPISGFVLLAGGLGLLAVRRP